MYETMQGKLDLKYNEYHLAFNQRFNKYLETI